MDDKALKIRKEVPLAPLSTFHIGGPARFFIQPESEDEFADAICWALKQGVEYTVLGGGANVLIHDRGFEGLVVSTLGLDSMEVTGETIEARCGVPVDRLVDLSAENGLAGLEFAAGLPGTVGGSLFMNARAYGSEFSRVTESARVLQVREGGVTRKRLKPEDLHFDYKKSVFQTEEWYVFSVRLGLHRGGKEDITGRIRENREKRKAAGQYLFPNAGCIFKNDYETGTPTGRIIDELGLRKTRIGDAEVFAEHGNFIVNRGKATARDVYRLINLVERTVREKRGVVLEREIRLVGPWAEE